MAAIIQKGGFGFDKLFRRQSRSPDEANGDEKNGKINGANDAAAKSQRSGSKSEKDKSSNDAKNDAANEIDDAASGKTEVSKKSKKKKSESGQEMAKTKDKTDNEETCKEYVIKDDVGQVKLTEIINNSIKEAVLSIVKESVCPLAESLEARPKEPIKKSPTSNPEETLDKENKPESPKNLSLLMSSANKTFDSHLCRSQCQSTNPYQTPVLPVVSPQRTIVQCNREPRVVKERKTKCPKPKEKKTRDVCPKVTRQAKGSSHFKTDNRRMTGNVNIYICSEANENTKDPKKKSKDENQCLEADSESASETKTCASGLSVSTSKLVAALRKKKRSKTLNDESLSCLCETSDSSQQNRSVEKINDDDVLCLCDDNEEPEFIPDSHSSSSRDGCLCEDAKFSDTDFPDSAGDSDFDSFDRFSTYDKNKKPWLRDNEDCTSYSNASKRFKNDDKAINQEIDSCCSCCNLKRCQKDRKGQSEKSCNRNGRTLRDVNGKRSSSSSRCPCIVEEEAEDCCADREESVEKITVCTNKPIDEDERADDKLGAINAESESGELKKTGSPDSIMTDDKKDPGPEKPKVRTKESKGSSSDREPKEIVKDVNKPAETSAISKDNPVPANEKRRDSFFRRSMNRAMSIVKARKDEDSSVTKKKMQETSVESQTAPQSKSDDSGIGQRINKIPCVPCCEIGEEKPMIVPCGSVNAERRSRSRISTAIASRRSLAVTNNVRSSLSLSPCQENASGKAKVQCQCEKPAESCDCCCKKPEPIDEDKCRGSNLRDTSNSSGCCKKLETPRPEISARCSGCRNPVGKCICRSHKPKVCACCPRCKRPMSECICHCPKPDKSEDECCDCCRRPKRLCCCENSPGKCRRPPEVPENRSQCKVCCRPSDECRCERKCCDCNDHGAKSMICMFCDQPRDKCICRAPIRKCSQCCMPLDVCNCKPTTCCDCSGRQIQQNDDNTEGTMCVTAWKPRRKVRRYFERSLANGNDVSDEDCACWEKPKPYGSDRLAYQKRGVFSDVMSELQQKISGSVCCNVCGKEPCCCCCVEEAPNEKMETAPCLSTIAERRSSAKSRKRSQSKSPIDSCKCEPNPRRRSGRQSTKVSRICDRCRTSPCRCKRASASPQKKPQAKCYYCKMAPCTCKPVEETTNSRSLRNNDSSNRRRKKRCGSIERKISDDFVNNDNNGHRGHEGKRFVPCSGNQQQQIRKYCYRGNSNGHSFISGERVR